MSAWLQRLLALLIKEWLQIMRDKSILAAAFLTPVLLLCIYGYGLNMDMQPVRVALVSESFDPLHDEVRAALFGSAYFALQEEPNMQAAQQVLRAHQVDALLYVPARQRLYQDGEFYAAINGSAALPAQLTLSYLQGALQPVWERLGSNTGVTAGALPLRYSITTRAWYNPDNKSVFYLLPGQLIGIATLVCNVLASLCIARECNRGTIDALLAAQVGLSELLLSKLLPNWLLSLASVSLLLILIEVLFALPVRGNIIFLGATLVLYALSCCLMGMWLSAMVQDQYLACEYAIILSFLPAILLSGAVFDLRTLPFGISLLGSLLPPTYAVQSVKICFLSGGNIELIWRNLAIICLYALLFLLLCCYALNRLRRMGRKVQ